MDSLSQSQHAMIDEAKSLIKHAEENYIHTSADLKNMTKERIQIILLQNLDLYEEYSERLLTQKYEIAKIDFPTETRDYILQELTEASKEIIHTLDLLRQTDLENQTPNEAVQAALQASKPIFDGQVQAESLTWTEFEDLFNEYLFMFNLRIDEVSLQYLEQFFVGEPRMIIKSVGNSTTPKSCLDKMRKMYSSRNYILKNILKSVKRTRIPHFKRESWGRIEETSTRLANLLKKIPNEGLTLPFEILDEVEKSLPLEKREIFLNGIKIRVGEEKIKFTLDLLTDIIAHSSNMKRKLKPRNDEEVCSSHDDDDVDYDEWDRICELQKENFLIQSATPEQYDYDSWLSSSDLDNVNYEDEVDYDEWDRSCKEAEERQKLEEDVSEVSKEEGEDSDDIFSFYFVRK